MQPPDLNHAERFIKQHEVAIQDLHRQAQVQRDIADQRRTEGAMTGPDYYEQEADRLEQQAAELEDELGELRVQKERFEKRIAELEDQKAHLAADSTERLARITQEINTLRGSSFML